MKLSRFDLRRAWGSALRGGIGVWAAVLGIALAVASMAAVESVGRAARLQAVTEMGRMGTEVLSLHWDLPDGRSLSAKTERRLSELISGVPVTGAYSARLAQLNCMVNVDGSAEGEGFALVATETSFLPVTGLSVSEGRFLSDSDGDERRVVLGTRVAQALEKASRSPALGARLTICEQVFRVVGVMRPEEMSSTPVMPVDMDGTALIGLGAAARLGEVPLSSLVMRLPSDEATLKVAAWLEATAPMALGRPAHVESATGLIQLKAQQLKTQESALLSMAALVLLLGVLGVANVMHMHVREHRWEIGLRMALGAYPAEIQRQYLSQAGLMGLLGGAIGACLGAVLAWVFCQENQLPTEWPVLTFGLSLPVSVLLGCLAGWWPAWQASHMDPIDALRSV